MMNAAAGIVPVRLLVTTWCIRPLMSATATQAQCTRMQMNKQHMVQRAVMTLTSSATGADHNVVDGQLLWAGQAKVVGLLVIEAVWSDIFLHLCHQACLHCFSLRACCKGTMLFKRQSADETREGFCSFVPADLIC